VVITSWPTILPSFRTTPEFFIFYSAPPNPTLLPIQKTTSIPIAVLVDAIVSDPNKAGTDT
jgi:hypothetical protein